MVAAAAVAAATPLSRSAGAPASSSSKDSAPVESHLIPPGQALSVTVVLQLPESLENNMVQVRGGDTGLVGCLL